MVKTDKKEEGKIMKSDAKREFAFACLREGWWSIQYHMLLFHRGKENAKQYTDALRDMGVVIEGSLSSLRGEDKRLVRDVGGKIENMIPRITDDMDQKERNRMSLAVYVALTQLWQVVTKSSNVTYSELDDDVDDLLEEVVSGEDRAIMMLPESQESKDLLEALGAI